jgi:restriction endonuclease S subunit
MSCEGWRKSNIGSLCDIRRGASPRPIHKYISNEGMPWVKIADATRDSSRYVCKTNEFIILDGVKKSVRVSSGDLILSNSATPGLPKLMKIDACIHDGWLLLSNFCGIDKQFMYYLLLHEKRKLVYSANGSVFNNLKTDIVRAHPVEVPPLPEQRAIARILSSLDDKIELNNRMNKTLEEIAQTLFKRWSVDFEFPDENGNPYKASGGKMVESEMGMIPDGWGVRPLSDIVDVLSGGTPSTKVEEYWNGDIPFFTPKDSSSGLYSIHTEKYITSMGLTKCNSRLYSPNMIFITARGTVGKTCLAGISMAMNQSCFALRSKNSISQQTMILYVRNVIKQINNSASGAVFDAINIATFNYIKVTIQHRR